MRSQQGSLLVGMLWCVALLAIVVVGLLHSATLQLRVAKLYGDRIQARFVALAGIEKTKALLEQSNAARKRSAVNHNGELFNAPDRFKNIRYARGEYSILKAPDNANGRSEAQYGVSDEESRLNVNQATVEQLSKIRGLTKEVAAAIVDFRDENSTPLEGGAEAEYYTGLKPSYVPRDSAYQSMHELLLVRGVTSDLLFGEDTNANGILDPEENDGDESDPPDNRDGHLDEGWAAMFSLHSISRNVNAAGEKRVDVQTADESTIAGVHGLTTEIAKAIVASRNQNKLGSIADLLDVVPPSNRPTPPQNPGNPNGNPVPSLPQTTSFQSSGAGPLINDNLLMQIADDITVVSEEEEPGLVNLNTASVLVLQCLEGMEPQIAQAIVDYRSSSGFFPNAAHLLRVPGMTRPLFKQLAPKVTTRSETYHVLSEGRIPSSGARSRIEMVFRFNETGVDVYSYREDF